MDPSQLIGLQRAEPIPFLEKKEKLADLVILQNKLHVFMAKAILYLRTVFSSNNSLDNHVYKIFQEDEKLMEMEKTGRIHDPTFKKARRQFLKVIWKLQTNNELTHKVSFDQAHILLQCVEWAETDNQPSNLTRLLPPLTRLDAQHKKNKIKDNNIENPAEVIAKKYLDRLKGKYFKDLTKALLNVRKEITAHQVSLERSWSGIEDDKKVRNAVENFLTVVNTIVKENEDIFQDTEDRLK